MTADEWLERAFFNAATGLYDESEAGASRALAAEPPLLAVLVARARRLASDGKLTEATPLLNAAARQFPQDPVVAELLGWTLLKQRRTDDAEAAFRQALKSDPKRAAGYEGIARVERERGQHHKSSQWFRQAADREPSGAFALEASRSLLMGGDPEAAWTEYLTAARCMGEAATSESRAMLARIAIEIGWGFFGAKKLAEAEAAFAAVRELDAINVDAIEGLARTARARGDTVMALELFERALAERPDDAMLRVEVARQLAALKRWNECAQAYDGLFASGFDLPKIEAASRAQLIEQWAVALQFAGRTQEAARAYRIFADHEPNNAQAILSSAPLAEQAGDLESALDLARRLLRPSEVWRGARLPVARCLVRFGRASLAADVLAPLIDASPPDSATVIWIARELQAQNELERGFALLRRAAELTSDPSALIDLGRELASWKEFEVALPVLARAESLAVGEPTLRFRLGLAMRQVGEDDRALAHLAKACDADPDDPLIRFEMAVSLFDLQRAEEGQRELDRVNAATSEVASEQLQVRWIEFACVAMRFDEADERLRMFDAIEDLPAAAVRHAATLAAFRGDWKRVLDLFEGRVVASRGGVYLPESFAEAVGRAARALGRQAEVLAQMAAVPGFSRMPAARRLQDQLAVELGLVRAVFPRLDGVALTPPSDPERARRGLAFGRAVAAAPTKPAGNFFICSDLAYLPGSIVALNSALRNNRAALRNCRMSFFVSDDALALADRLVSRIVDAHGLPINLVPASQLGGDTSNFRIDWGFFSPGHRLSDAAYYRILAALRLAEECASGRAVYVDSDVCLGPGLAQMFQFDLGGRPIGARRERSEMAPIRRAARKLGIPVDGYFNSGVMIFDLAHPEMAPALVRALDIARTQPERLSYVDQCALNLAFVGRAAPLPTSFNHFIRSQGRLWGEEAEAVVVHYLGRPKPWDPAYPTANANQWMREFQALGDVLAPEDFRDLLSVLFPEAGAYNESKQEPPQPILPIRS